jgi:hypothetical protein
VNIDDYHSGHSIRRPDHTSTSNFYHFANSTCKTLPTIPAIPHLSQNKSPVGTERAIDVSSVISVLRQKFHWYVGMSYLDQCGIAGILPGSEMEALERASHYAYDGSDVSNCCSDIMLLDCHVTPLKSTTDYLNTLDRLMELPYFKLYLQNYVILLPADFPGVRHI